MMMLITYDVNTETKAGRTRLRKVAKLCTNKGQRVQNSVFECLLDSTQFAILRSSLEKVVDPSTDSLRYYFLGDKWRNRVEHFGAKSAYDPEGILIT